jgi:DNA-binding LytR/AlgR family response regulator
MKENEILKTYGRIVFPGYENNVIEDPNKILLIEICKRCIFITFDDGIDMTQAVSLGFMEARLNPARFMRCDHPFIVNGHFVKSLRRNKRGLLAIMKKGKDPTVSVRKKDKFLDFIKRIYTDI